MTLAVIWGFPAIIIIFIYLWIRLLIERSKYSIVGCMVLAFLMQAYALSLAMIRHDPFGILIPVVPLATWFSLLALSFAMLIDSVAWANRVFDQRVIEER
ncbi:MAG: hypothetical protein ACXADC_01885 [Candidatus Thorarchaeota archaeon]|jgi:hypothetical protein